ncbi:uncharacterized protein [Nicotiana tomentosiformis]|uniref:uncharacterized protein n=1 Tax=Nicotiana tomentosiformis TaxID=4098 RepID=UPI00388C9DCA
MPAQPVILVQPEVRPEASEEEQKRIGRFKKYDPPTLCGAVTEDVQGFLDKCHCILCTKGIVEVSRVAFTTFQLSGAVCRWWQAFEEDRPADAAPLTWTQFFYMFFWEFVPQTLMDEWRTKFEQLQHGAMTVSEHATRFSELSRHAPALVSTVRERVRRFIEGLSYGLRLGMAWELETDASFH